MIFQAQKDLRILFSEALLFLLKELELR